MRLDIIPALRNRSDSPRFAESLCRDGGSRFPRRSNLRSGIHPAINGKIPSAPLVTKTVLIADDSASVRLSVRLLLQGRHKEIVVREAFDGMDAIEKAKRSKPRFDTSGPRDASREWSRSGYGS
jgi:hypothetical protein